MAEDILSTKAGKRALIGIALIGIAAFIIFAATYKPPDPALLRQREEQRAEQKRQEEEQKRQEEEAKRRASWDSDDGKITAYVMSQKFLEKRLKAPATADYPWYSTIKDGVTHDGEGSFTVRAYVDSQNSFGAKIRTRYICKLKDVGGDKWELVSLTTE